MRQSFDHSPISRIAFIGNYLPRQCGIATFTTDLCEAIAAEHSGSTCIAVPVNDIEGGYAYPPRVRFELTEKDIESYRRAADFLTNRLPKFFDYFGQMLKRNPKGSEYLLGKKVSYVDLSLFQMIEGLRYAFPKTMARLEPHHSRLVALHDCVMARPRIAAYLASPRRLPFNEDGIFRHYPELEEG